MYNHFVEAIFHFNEYVVSLLLGQVRLDKVKLCQARLSLARLGEVRSGHRLIKRSLMVMYNHFVKAIFHFNEYVVSLLLGKVRVGLGQVRVGYFSIGLVRLIKRSPKVMYNHFVEAIFHFNEYVVSLLLGQDKIGSVRLGQHRFGQVNQGEPAGHVQPLRRSHLSL